MAISISSIRNRILWVLMSLVEAICGFSGMCFGFVFFVALMIGRDASPEAQLIRVAAFGMSLLALSIVLLRQKGRDLSKLNKLKPLLTYFLEGLIILNASMFATILVLGMGYVCVASQANELDSIWIKISEPPVQQPSVVVEAKHEFNLNQVIGLTLVGFCIGTLAGQKLLPLVWKYGTIAQSWIVKRVGRKAGAGVTTGNGDGMVDKGDKAIWIYRWI